MWLRDTAGSESQPQAGEGETEEDTALRWVAMETAATCLPFLLEDAGEVEHTCQCVSGA